MELSFDNSRMGKSQGQSRSKATKERILAAARALFGENGFDRTTVRLVATKASIHPSLVIRYFGSKEELFASAVEFDLRLPDFATIRPDQRGRSLARYLIERWEGPNAGGELPALLRVAVTHPEGKAKLYRIFQEQLVPKIADVVSKKGTNRSAALMATQALGLAFTRYVVEIPAVVALSKDEIVRDIGATFQRYFEL